MESKIQEKYALLRKQKEQLQAQAASAAAAKPALAAPATNIAATIQQAAESLAEVRAAAAPTRPTMKRARRPEAAAAASAPAASSGAGGNAQKKARHGDGGVRRSGPTGLTTRQLDALELPDQLSQFLDVAGLNKHSTPLPPELVTYMRGLLRDHPEIRMVCQVGLHNGMLVELLLAERSDISVVTVDAAHYPEVAAAAQHYFDRKFPLRHMLVMGDSRMGVPMVAQVVGAHKFDLIILGGTSVQEEAERDLRSARILAHRDTLVMRNGIVRYKADGIGPCSAWTVVVKLGEVQELEFHHTPTFEHAWGVGRYCDRPASEGAMQEKKTMAESFWDNNRTTLLWEFGLRLDKHCRTGSDALKVWGEMLAAGFEPDSWAYNSCLKWLKRDPEPHPMLTQLRAEMQTKGYKELDR